MARPDLDHSWEGIQEALKKIGQEQAVDQPEVPPREKPVIIQPEVPSGKYMQWPVALTAHSYIGYT